VGTYDQADELIDRPSNGGTVHSIEITGDFQYDAIPVNDPKGDEDRENGGKAKRRATPTSQMTNSASFIGHNVSEQPALPFALRAIDLKIPHGRPI